ncbi:hypothetical protein GQF56_16030 [Rhodobacter sphaeroides]|uniref:Uncharacterized protein n=1 Tax=Cereibacter sphaeroides (strain ATCC 17023 / DSM 158 / JCM 6121 / CCUG 31486 / LMG 2827 / NBRC 12203 / NCIMB 8253 / ATH 2.4.1.) TaxID=272943 RepID=Q3IW24_CERS4|nr:hypothetical protein RSP_3647 [Cereibacter sphaeroides 2.4.1]AXC63554.1 hypothetical protein DQL45_19435 [Cereibacter sphaeroides 2.4.1]MVX49361.1 hypothetical protein [Cereibacter sphaeroides]QHA11973.1 hypothetical protein GQR99_19420 [Cereibacter sphaeroides]QHA15128.1 hypothetical protein GQY06_19380 [Cereibacter sphaeroides]
MPVILTVDRLLREEGPVLIFRGRTGSPPANLRSFPAGFADRLWRRGQVRERRIAFEPCRLQPRDLRPPRVGFGGDDRLRCGVGALCGLAVTGPRWVRLGRAHSCSLFCWRDRSSRAYSGRSGRHTNVRLVAVCAAPGSGLLCGAGTGRREGPNVARTAPADGSWPGRQATALMPR